jgi:hypothetical protein
MKIYLKERELTESKITYFTAEIKIQQQDMLYKEQKQQI